MAACDGFRSRRPVGEKDAGDLSLHPHNDMPKIANLKRQFPASFRTEPVLVAKGGIGG